jgi:hypothetical protein
MTEDFPARATKGAVPAPGASARAPERTGSRPVCGWYDSSHDLQQGLSVIEHLDAGSLGAELPLSSWLELHLSGWQLPV